MSKPGILLILGFLFFACKSDISRGHVLPFRVHVDTSLTYVKLEFTDNSKLTDTFIDNLNLRILHKTIPMLSQKSKEHNTITMYPPIVFTAGITYGIYYQDILIDSFMIMPKNHALAQIIGIYPTQDSLPENLLKIYIEFDTPMQSGEVMKYIHLINQDNDTLKETLLEMNEELWNTDRTRLTIWLHPGRVKRGLIPNEKMGNPLEAGKSYTLSITSQWQSQSGSTLSKDYTKEFFVINRDETIPNYKNWKIKADPTKIVITFDEALDYALLHDSLFHIINATDKRINGQLSTIKNCRQIEFIPYERLPTGTYNLIVYSILEDLAGNNLNHLFDRAVYTSNKVEKKYHTIPFSITDLNFIRQ